MGAKEIVEQRRLARGLRTEYGDKVVVEACGDNMFDVEVFGNVGAVLRRLVSCFSFSEHVRPKMYTLEHLVLVNNLNAMFVSLVAGIVANICEMGVHHHAGSGGMANIARSGPVDLECIRGHDRMAQPRAAARVREE